MTEQREGRRHEVRATAVVAASAVVTTATAGWAAAQGTWWLAVLAGLGGLGWAAYAGVSATLTRVLDIQAQQQTERAAAAKKAIAEFLQSIEQAKYYAELDDELERGL